MGRKSLRCATDRWGLAGKLAQLVLNSLPLLFGDELPSAHSTAQGMWISYMLKYRYPKWIEQNYK